MFAFRPSSQEIFGLEWQHMATIPEQSFWDGCHIVDLFARWLFQ
jgi:hypothetical protein